MTYLVTGGTGFIGAHIVALLAASGERVVAYDLNPISDLLTALLDQRQRGHVDTVSGDITDAGHLLTTCREHHVGQIIHMAGMLSTATAEAPALATRVNCVGTANVLETARALKARRVVLASSAAVFGPPERYEQGVLPNDAPHYPSSVYGACKSFAERLADFYFREFGVDSIALRFPAVYGVGQRGGTSAVFTEELMVKPALGKRSEVPSGDGTFNWLHVDDAARAAVMASRAPTTRTRAFNLSGDVRQVRDVAGIVMKLVPQAQISLLPGQVGIAARYDTTRIEEEIGFRPQCPIERGIEEVIRETRLNAGPP